MLDTAEALFLCGRYQFPIAHKRRRGIGMKCVEPEYDQRLASTSYRECETYLKFKCVDVNAARSCCEQRIGRAIFVPAPSRQVRPRPPYAEARRKFPRGR